jgi:hypothetical protein
VQVQINTYRVAYAYWRRWQNLNQDSNQAKETH